MVLSILAFALEVYYTLFTIAALYVRADIIGSIGADRVIAVEQDVMFTLVLR